MKDKPCGTLIQKSLKDFRLHLGLILCLWNIPLTRRPQPNLRFERIGLNFV